MAYRNGIEQSKHDRIVQASADTYKSGKIYTNPDGEKNTSISGLYPDVIVSRPNGIIIEEVETESSINEHEKDQWKKYASLGYRFHLIVPWSMKDTARYLVRDIPIDRLQWYWIENGSVRFGDV